MIANLRMRLSPSKKSADVFDYKPNKRGSTSLPSTPTPSIGSVDTTNTTNTVLTSDPLPQITEEDRANIRKSSTVSPALARLMGMSGDDDDEENNDLYHDSYCEEDDAVRSATKRLSNT
ncbi:hypothetical protein TrLO_g932 [Triparma laevis f. longispina]|uniref:Uncharacterized protein n=1 Tax=Triparma laevis f. longispina TaxID=1714387 RepID=A0A9W7FKE3_9STRA|nr:hypothetical protein TrLO_g932 [Triparma laevis f. longispina]